MHGETAACRYCGEEHTGRICPLIRAMDFYESAALKRVEFFEQKAAESCQHRNKIDMSAGGFERWRCRDCGTDYEKALTPGT